MHCFSNLFWYRTLHVSDRFTVYHQEPSTVYTAIGQHNLYDKYLLLRIQQQTPDDGQYTSPKHVEFYTKINLRKHVHCILKIKTNEMHCFSNLFWYRTLHASDSFTVHHQESSIVYTATGICHTGYADLLLCIQYQAPDDRQ